MQKSKTFLEKWGIWIAVPLVVVAVPALLGSFETSVQVNVNREAPHILRAFPKDKVAQLGCETVTPACLNALAPALVINVTPELWGLMKTIEVRSHLAPQPANQPILTCSSLLGRVNCYGRSGS